MVLSRGASKALDKLETRTAKKTMGAMQEIQRDLLRQRPVVDILKIRGREEPPAYRLKLGGVRIEYLIFEDENTIYVERIFKRKGDSDYR
ncbi:MAG TPA: type II toxin-antitoxin system RelE/ParE family toxin [Methanothrix sp.]|nr:type II toxin-antitoxin system RelE/ParE family toxin [Methanothrix sp.]HOV52130.1 type II toxin-antitoxin system RelE/ParE family toxin [Methanothrix sp.]